MKRSWFSAFFQMAMTDNSNSCKSKVMNCTYQCGLGTSIYPNYPALISVAAAAKPRPDTVQG